MKLIGVEYTDADKERVMAMVKECPTFTQFKNEYKCCYNCPSWDRDATLMNDYEYNACLKTNPPQMTKCSWHCECYNGNMNFKQNPHPILKIENKEEEDGKVDK